MAISAITPRQVFDLGGNQKMILGSFTPDNSWLAAGEVLSITGVERIEELWVTGGSSATVAVRFEWDPASQKILAFRTDQVDDYQEAIPDTTDISALTLRCVAIGQ